MSRVIERRYVLGEVEQEKFREIMRKVEDFSGSFRRGVNHDEDQCSAPVTWGARRGGARRRPLAVALESGRRQATRHMKYDRLSGPRAF
jgi:hypothetical protein